MSSISYKTLCSPTSRAFCGLLEIDEYRILLDCGWDLSFNVDDLVELKAIAPTIHAVLITHGSVYHMGALPYIIDLLPESTVIYATTPVHTLCRVILNEVVVNNGWDDNYVTISEEFSSVPALSNDMNDSDSTEQSTTKVSLGYRNILVKDAAPQNSFSIDQNTSQDVKSIAPAIPAISTGMVPPIHNPQSQTNTPSQPLTTSTIQMFPERHTSHPYNLQTIDRVFTRIHPMSYNEETTVKSTFKESLSSQSLVIFCNLSGHTIGGAIWYLCKDNEEITYAANVNHVRETSIDSFKSFRSPSANRLMIIGNTSHDLRPYANVMTNKELFEIFTSSFNQMQAMYVDQQTNKTEYLTALKSSGNPIANIDMTENKPNNGSNSSIGLYYQQLQLLYGVYNLVQATDRKTKFLESILSVLQSDKSAAASAGPSGSGSVVRPPGWKPKKQGSIFLPVEETLRIIEIMCILEDHWTANDFAYPIVFVGKYASQFLSLVKDTMTSWASESIQKALMNQPMTTGKGLRGKGSGNLFSFDSIKTATSYEEAKDIVRSKYKKLPENLRGPAIYITSAECSLRCGPTLEMFKQILPVPTDMIILTEVPFQYFNPFLQAQLKSTSYVSKQLIKPAILAHFNKSSSSSSSKSSRHRRHEEDDKAKEEEVKVNDLIDHPYERGNLLSFLYHFSDASHGLVHQYSQNDEIYDILFQSNYVNNLYYSTLQQINLAQQNISINDVLTSQILFKNDDGEDEELDILTKAILYIKHLYESRKSGSGGDHNDSDLASLVKKTSRSPPVIFLETLQYKPLSPHEAQLFTLAWGQSLRYQYNQNKKEFIHNQLLLKQQQQMQMNNLMMLSKTGALNANDALPNTLPDANNAMMMVQEDEEGFSESTTFDLLFEESLHTAGGGGSITGKNTTSAASTLAPLSEFTATSDGTILNETTLATNISSTTSITTGVDSDLRNSKRFKPNTPIKLHPDNTDPDLNNSSDHENVSESDDDDDINPLVRLSRTLSDTLSQSNPNSPAFTPVLDPGALHPETSTSFLRITSRDPLGKDSANNKRSLSILQHDRNKTAGAKKDAHDDGDALEEVTIQQPLINDVYGLSINLDSLLTTVQASTNANPSTILNQFDSYKQQHAKQTVRFFEQEQQQLLSQPPPINDIWKVQHCYEPIEMKCQLLTIPLTVYIDQQSTTNYVSTVTPSPHQVILYKGVDSLRSLLQFSFNELNILELSHIFLPILSSTLRLTSNTSIKKFVLSHDLLSRLKFSSISSMYSIAPITAQIVMDDEDNSKSVVAKDDDEDLAAKSTNVNQNIIPMLTLPNASAITGGSSITSRGIGGVGGAGKQTVFLGELTLPALKKKLEMYDIPAELHRGWLLCGSKGKCIIKKENETFYVDGALCEETLRVKDILYEQFKILQ